MPLKSFCTKQPKKAHTRHPEPKIKSEKKRHDLTLVIIRWYELHHYIRWLETIYYVRKFVCNVRVCVCDGRVQKCKRIKCKIVGSLFVKMNSIC